MRCFFTGLGRTPPLPAFAFITNPAVFAGPLVDTVTPVTTFESAPLIEEMESSRSRFTPLCISPAAITCPPGVGAGVGIGVCRAAADMAEGVLMVVDRGVPTPAGVMPEG